MLEENSQGVPVVGDLLPGEEEYGWAFEYRGEHFRPGRGRGKSDVVATVEGADEQDLETEGSDVETENDDVESAKHDFETFFRGLGPRLESEE